MDHISKARGSSPGVLVVLTAILLAACGGSDGGPTSGGNVDVQIDMKNIAFVTPNGTDSITVSVGSVIGWTNRDQGIPHTATSDSLPAGAQPFDADLSTGESFTYTVSKAGRYVYHCEVHPVQMAHAVIIAK